MTSVQEVPLKIALVRSGEVVEIRRRRLVNPSYGVVEKVASEVARGKYRLQYTDEDGDVVTMSSQEEWEECLASWDASHPLKLRIELRGPRGLGRRGCGSGSSSRSRSTSSRRRCHRSRSRSVSSTRKHHHWGRAASSRHGSPFGRTHSPSRFQAWLAKMDAARRMEQVSGRSQAEHPFLCRGFPFGAKGMHGHGKGFNGMHSHCGSRRQPCETPTEAPEKTNDMPSRDEQPQAEHPFFLFRDLIRAFAGKGMHGHGKGPKGAHGHGGKGCKGMPEHAGHRHMHKHGASKRANDMSSSDEEPKAPQAEFPLFHPFRDLLGAFAGRGMHGHGNHGGKGCKGTPEHAGHRHMHKHDCTPADAAEKTNDMPSSVGQSEAPQAEHPFFLFRDLLGAFAGKGMHGHGKGSKGAHGRGGKGCKGMPEHAGHRRMHHGRRAVNGELIGQKCANCEFQTTGVVDLYCCRACMFGKDHHGERCQQLPFAEEDEQKAAEQTPQSAVANVQFSNEEAQRNTTEPSLTQQDEELPAVVEEEPTPNTTEEPQTVAVDEQPSTAEEERPIVQAPFACQIAQLQEMGFAVTPQVVDNLEAVNGDLAAVMELFAQ